MGFCSSTFSLPPFTFPSQTAFTRSLCLYLSAVLMLAQQVHTRFLLGFFSFDVNQENDHRTCTRPATMYPASTAWTAVGSCHWHVLTKNAALKQHTTVKRGTISAGCSFFLIYILLLLLLLLSFSVSLSGSQFQIQKEKKERKKKKTILYCQFTDIYKNYSTLLDLFFKMLPIVCDWCSKQFLRGPVDG